MRFLTCSLLALAASCSAQDTAPPATAPVATRVLFVGNSLTYVNDLPRTVAAIARDNGDSLTVAMAAGPDLALIDHLTGGSNAPALLRDSSWNFVVLQQGPTTTAMCRDSMVLWTGMFNPLITRARGASITLMTWPSTSQGDVWSMAHITSILAAASVHGIMAPAGDAWQSALAAHPGLPLYGPDGYHPADMGTFLTALVVYQRITGRDPLQLAPHAFSNGALRTMGADTVRWLQAAAASANAATPAQPSAPDPVPPPQPTAPGATRC